MSRVLRTLVPVVVTLWWLPTILVTLVLAVVAFYVNTRRLVRRARRLRLAGRLDEAAAVLERAGGGILTEREPGDAP